VKKNLLFLCLLGLCSSTLFGQAGKFPKVVHTTEKSAIHLPPQETPADLKIIYSNFGTATDLYDATEGWGLQGPNSGYTEFIGMPFTPQSNSHVSEVRVAAHYIGGANQVNLSLYSDASAAPGMLLAGPVTVTGLPEYGTCCAVAVADFPPVAVIAGTQYWVVADTPLTGTGSDFLGAWNWVVKAAPEWAQDGDDVGWFPIPSDSLPAGGVLGTIP
jgi:hypothetical protein